MIHSLKNGFENLIQNYNKEIKATFKLEKREGGREVLQSLLFYLKGISIYFLEVSCVVINVETNSRNCKNEQKKET